MGGGGVAGGSNRDWIKIRTEYETTAISTRKLAAKYNVPVSTLQLHCCKEKWTKHKIDFVADVNAKLRQRVATRKINAIAKSLDPALEATDLINQLVLDTLKDTQQFTRHLVQKREKGMAASEDGDGISTERWWVEEEQFNVVDARRLKDLTSALKISKELQRLLQGMVSPADEQKLKIERERLELEKTRAGINDGEDDDTGVVILPEVNIEVDNE